MEDTLTRLAWPETIEYRTCAIKVFQEDWTVWNIFGFVWVSLLNIYWLFHVFSPSHSFFLPGMALVFRVAIQRESRCSSSHKPSLTCPVGTGPGCCLGSDCPALHECRCSESCKQPVCMMRHPGKSLLFRHLKTSNWAYDWWSTVSHTWIVCSGKEKVIMCFQHTVILITVLCACWWHLFFFFKSKWRLIYYRRNEV